MNSKKLREIDKNILYLCNENTFKMFDNTKYNINDLEYIIINTSCSMRAILFTQYLTSEFCKKYILETDFYCTTNMDEYISIDDILYCQPHINIEDLN
tara:strand:- start:182 stop:475 length:294 start_codon:yes stop_codon:yes gene_type:complete